MKLFPLLWFLRRRSIIIVLLFRHSGLPTWPWLLLLLLMLLLLLLLSLLLLMLLLMLLIAR